MRSASALSKNNLNSTQKIWLFFSSLSLGVVLFYYVFLPLQGHMGLNLIAVVEPYFRWSRYLRALQAFIIFSARFFLLPFYVYLGYRLSRAFIMRVASHYPNRKEGSTPEASVRPKKKATHVARDLWEKTLLPVKQRLSSLLEVLSEFHTAIRVHSHRMHRRMPAPLRIVSSTLARIPRSLFNFLLYGYMGICSVVVCLEAVFFSLLIIKVTAHPSGAVAFYNTCGQCHGFNRPLNFNHTARIWEITVDRMIRHAPVLDKPFPVDKREDIIQFLCAIRSYSNQRLLQSKCYLCHTPFRIFERSRTKNEWSLLIDRVQRQNPFYITPRQAEQVLIYIAGKRKWTREDTAPGTEESLEFERKLVFEQKCGTCHTLDIIFMPHIQKADWGRTLLRMGEKEPDFLSSEEALSVLPLIAKRRQDKKTFLLDFPHSTMREKSCE